MRNFRFITIVMSVIFLFSIVAPSVSFAQAPVSVMTLADGTTVSMTPSQLSTLATQPGITILATPAVTATQVAVPIPSTLGGGFIVAEPAALATGMNAVGITTAATATSVVGATAVTGAIIAGATAGVVVAGAVSTGTIVAGVAVAAVVGVVVASLGGETSATSATKCVTIDGYGALCEGDDITTAVHHFSQAHGYDIATSHTHVLTKLHDAGITNYTAYNH